MPNRASGNMHHFVSVVGNLHLPLKTPCALGKLIFYKHAAHVTPNKLRKVVLFRGTLHDLTTLHLDPFPWACSEEGAALAQVRVQHALFKTAGVTEKGAQSEATTKAHPADPRGTFMCELVLPGERPKLIDLWFYQHGWKRLIC